jgi:hypothetical protein
MPLQSAPVAPGVTRDPKATPRGADIARRGVRGKNSGSDLLSHTETVQYHRLWRA